MKKILFLLAICFVFGKFSNAQEAPKNTEKIEILTSSVCGMCKEKIEKEIGFSKGVRKAELNKGSKILTVYYNPKKTTPEAIRLRVSKTGYDADDMKADEKAYNKLPSCCKKDSKCTD